jgi:hypothetical protein
LVAHPWDGATTTFSTSAVEFSRLILGGSGSVLMGGLRRRSIFRGDQHMTTNNTVNVAVEFGNASGIGRHRTVHGPIR